MGRCWGGQAAQQNLYSCGIGGLPAALGEDLLRVYEGFDEQLRRLGDTRRCQGDHEDYEELRSCVHVVILAERGGKSQYFRVIGRYICPLTPVLPSPSEGRGDRG
jgi:hypothetical protein